MLNILRNKAQSTFIQIIVGIIALVFIFWGVGANLSGSRQTAILVNDHEITFQQYQQAYNAMYEQFAAQFGGSIPKGLDKQLNIKGQVINQLVQEELVRQGARAMGIVVSNEDVRNKIKKIPQFQKDGHFDMETYEKVLAASGRHRSQFEKQVKNDYLSGLAMVNISGFADFVSEFEIENIYSEINEKAAVDFIRFLPADFAGDVVVDEEKLEKWYEGAKERYKSEPKKKFRYITFLYDDIAGRIEIDDAAVQNYYQENKQAFTKRVDEKETTQPFEEVREEIIQQLRRKEAQKLAFQLADDTYEGIINAGSVDNYSKEEKGQAAGSKFQVSEFITPQTAPQKIAADAAFMQAGFALNKEELSSLIKGESGYAIFYLDDIQEAVTPKLSEVREKAEADYRKEKAAELAKEAAEKFLKKIKEKKGADFRESAEAEGYAVYNSGLLSKRGMVEKEAGEEKAEKVKLPPELTAAAFTLTKKKPLTDEVKEAGSNFYILSFEKRELPKMPENSPEYAIYKGSMRNMKEQQLFSAWLQHLREKADVRYHQSLE